MLKDRHGGRSKAKEKLENEAKERRQRKRCRRAKDLGARS